MVPDILEAVRNVVQSFTDAQPKSPLHVGEVMACWEYVALMSESQIHSEAGINSTSDPELKQALHEAVKLTKSQKEQLVSFMQTEGIPVPPMSESKPVSNPSDVPLGVKLTDDEIANSLVMKIVLAIETCADGAAQAIRNDVGLIWAEFLQEHMVYGTNLKTLMKKRGWLKIPPLYYAPGSTSNH